MGCDGGTIPRRDELVRMKKKPEQKDKNAEAVAKWKHCAISQEPLRSPIVSCELGKLYNKEAVIENLLKKEASCEVACHIRNLKDIKELRLTENSSYPKNSSEKGDRYIDLNDSRYICPIVGLEMNGKYRFCFLWKCGCVLSERAIKEAKSDVCHKCGKPFGNDDIIVINGTDEELLVLGENMKLRRQKLKMEKKRKREGIETVVDEKKVKSKDEASTSSSNVSINKDSKTSNLPDCDKSITINKSNVSSAAKWILPEKAKINYSIARDPTASAAYKSLFTTHKDAKQQAKAHWVTHNPLYF